MLEGVSQVVAEFYVVLEFGSLVLALVAGTDDVSSFVILEVDGMVNQVCAVRGPSKEDNCPWLCVVERVCRQPNGFVDWTF